ncbi:hypothetical protein AGRA3207_002199 [Actinomadura graeca]|uniref:Peptidase C45 hydrolase domain-containing protein n=1 Tax=Actinomadura graeca TaxID=2750812 RepID=A0ABX8QTR9_9ACTN|nr:C45 family autoproteolytic acyltransferase/hydolase [Actinomadura graeca]QXJ21354.1 hypothetical protein AGRA3207_002199 [Actinomadura graeca]
MNGTPRPPVRTVRLHGSAFEAGVRYGTGARAEIRTSITRYAAVFAAAGLGSWADAVSAAQRYAQPIAHHAPDSLEQMRGMARGADLELGDILALNARSELMFGISPSTFPDDGCTSLAVLPERSAGAGMLLAQNWDWIVGARESVVLLVREEGERPGYVALVEAGLLAKTGINTAGLGLCTNTLVSTTEDGTSGVPYHVLLHQLLQMERVSDGLRLLYAVPRALSANYLLAHRDGTAVDVETAPGGPDGVALLTHDDGVIAHTNHFRDARLSRTDLRLRESPHTAIRLDRVTRRLAAVTGEIGTAEVLDALTDHANHPLSVCLHPDTRRPPSARFATLATVVYELADGGIRLGVGQPCTAEFARLDLAGLLTAGGGAERAPRLTVAARPCGSQPPSDAPPITGGTGGGTAVAGSTTGTVSSKTQATLNTVLGPVDPASAGQILPHEHMFVDFRRRFSEPHPSVSALTTREPVQLANLGWVRYNQRCNIDNLVLDDLDVAVTELVEFAAAGGTCVVDLTPPCLGRDVAKLVALSRRTGVDVVMGTGYYLDEFQSPAVRSMSVEQLADSMIAELTTGVAGTGARAGVIGEIGCSWPLTGSERRVLRGAALAQRQTGAAISVHPGRDPAAPFEIVEILRESGADLERVVIGHLDRTIAELDPLLRLASLGPYLEFDLFGQESSHTRYGPVDLPNDLGRLKVIGELVRRGHGHQVLVSHDIALKHRLDQYGGHGYAHLARRVLPRMPEVGLTPRDVDLIVRGNPARMLAFPRVDDTPRPLPERPSGPTPSVMSA